MIFLKICIKMRETKLGTPPKKLGKFFEQPLKKFTLWGGFFSRKRGNYSKFLRDFVGSKQEFYSRALRNFSPSFLEGYPTQFPSFSLIDVGKKQKSWFLKPITGSQRFPLTTIVSSFLTAIPMYSHTPSPFVTPLVKTLLRRLTPAVVSLCPCQHWNLVLVVDTKSHSSTNMITNLVVLHYQTHFFLLHFHLHSVMLISDK